MFAAALGAVLLAAPAAQAFTFHNQASGDGAANALASGVKPYVDPTDKLDALKESLRASTATAPANTRSGGMTLQFGRQPNIQRKKYDPDYLYDPLRR